MHDKVGLNVKSRVTFKYIPAAEEMLWDAAPVVWERNNTFMYDGIAILTYMLAGVDKKVNGMYFEYANTTTPESIVIPKVNPPDGVEYYRSLPPGKDYLRVTATTDGAVSSSGAPYKANRVNFMGFSGGASAGMNGTPFSSISSSCVYGAALVYLDNDPANDLIYGRLYVTTATPLADNQQAGARWTTTLMRRD